MNGVATVLRLTTILAVAALTGASGMAIARDTTQGLRAGLSVAIVSNGVVTYKIPNGPGGLELSSNAPGTITVTSGSNSVTVRGPALTLSGGVVLAPFSTPGVHVTSNSDGGYTAELDTLLSVLPDPEMPELDRGHKQAGERARRCRFWRPLCDGRPLRCAMHQSENSASP